MEIKPIAEIKTDFPEKFGVPRQAAKGSSLFGTVVFRPEFSSGEAVRGLAEYSHIWLIWGFSENKDAAFHPTVRPPKLGGNKRIGVFATRSPFRPNGLGISCVQLVSVDSRSNPVTLKIKGVDMVDGTPVYDIKPYIPYTDCVQNAAAAPFCEAAAGEKLKVTFSAAATGRMPNEKAAQLTEILENNPRPSYQTDSERLYKLSFAGYEIGFRVMKDEINVISVKPTQ